MPSASDKEIPKNRGNTKSKVQTLTTSGFTGKRGCVIIEQRRHRARSDYKELNPKLLRNALCESGRHFKSKATKIMFEQSVAWMDFKLDITLMIPGGIHCTIYSLW